MQTVAILCRELIPDRRTDGELLNAFLAGPAEDAFTELIRRHGPLVWSACRRLLPNPADAEDAFQAAFVVLVRRASRLTTVVALGPWIHRVAVWTARNIRRKNARRLARQSELPAYITDPSAPPDSDLKADLDAALLALPACYRDSIVLCHLQGFSRREAAERLGCPEGTLSGWLNRGLEKLRHRLAGLDPAKVLSVPAIAVPSVLAANTARAAIATTLATASIPPAVSPIVEGVLRMFWMKKATAATVALFATFALGVGMGVSTRSDFTGVTANEDPTPGKPGAILKSKPKPSSTWSDLDAVIADVETQLKSTKRALEATTAGLTEAEKRVAIVEKGFQNGFVPESELRDAQLTATRFQKNVDEMEARLKAFQEKLAVLKAEKAKQEQFTLSTPKPDYDKLIAELEMRIRVTQAEYAQNRAGVKNVDEVEARLKALQDKLAALKAAKAKQERLPQRAPKTEPDKRFAELETQLRAAQAQYEQSRVGVEEAKNRLAVAEKEHKTAKDASDGRDPERLAALLQKAKNLRDAEQRFEQFRDKADASMNQLRKLKDQLAAVKAEAELKEKPTKQPPTDDIEKRVQELKKELERLEGQSKQPLADDIEKRILKLKQAEQAERLKKQALEDLEKLKLDLQKQKLEQLEKLKRQPMTQDYEKLLSERNELLEQQWLHYLRQDNPKIVQDAIEQLRKRPVPDHDQSLLQLKMQLDRVEVQRHQIEELKKQSEAKTAELTRQLRALEDASKSLRQSTKEVTLDKHLQDNLVTAKKAGEYLELRVHDKNAAFEFTLTETTANGKILATVIIREPAMLSTILTRTHKDPNAPKELHVVVDSTKMSDGVQTALKACEAAGYKTVKFTGPVLQGGGDQSEYKHYKAAEKNPAKLLKEIEDGLRRW